LKKIQKIPAVKLKPYQVIQFDKPKKEQTEKGRVSYQVSTFIHVASAQNINVNSTYLDIPSINGNPNAIILVTANWNPKGSRGVYNNHPIGVWYNTKKERWAIFNQDRAKIPVNAAFNVCVIPF
jgi:spore germination protein GerM